LEVSVISYLFSELIGRFSVYYQRPIGSKSVPYAPTKIIEYLLTDQGERLW
jgi:hypothetical protein